MIAHSVWQPFVDYQLKQPDSLIMMYIPDFGELLDIIMTIYESMENLLYDNTGCRLVYHR